MTIYEKMQEKIEKMLRTSDEEEHETVKMFVRKKLYNIQVLKES